MLHVLTFCQSPHCMTSPVGQTTHTRCCAQQGLYALGRICSMIALTCAQAHVNAVMMPRPCKAYATVGACWVRSGSTGNKGKAGAGHGMKWTWRMQPFSLVEIRLQCMTMIEQHSQMQSGSSPMLNSKPVQCRKIRALNMRPLLLVAPFRQRPPVLRQT